MRELRREIVAHTFVDKAPWLLIAAESERKIDKRPGDTGDNAHVLYLTTAADGDGEFLSAPFIWFNERKLLRVAHSDRSHSHLLSSRRETFLQVSPDTVVEFDCAYHNRKFQLGQRNVSPSARDAHEAEFYLVVNECLEGNVRKV